MDGPVGDYGVRYNFITGQVDRAPGADKEPVGGAKDTFEAPQRGDLGGPVRYASNDLIATDAVYEGARSDSGLPSGASYLDLGDSTYGANADPFADSTNPNGSAATSNQLGDFGIAPTTDMPYVSAERLTGGTDPNTFFFATGEAPRTIDPNLFNGKESQLSSRDNTDILDSSGRVGAFDADLGGGLGGSTAGAGTVPDVGDGALDGALIAGFGGLGVVQSETAGNVTYLSYQIDPGSSTNQLAKESSGSAKDSFGPGANGSGSYGSGKHARPREFFPERIAA